MLADRPEKQVARIIYLCGLMRKKRKKQQQLHLKFEPGTSGTPGEVLTAALQCAHTQYGKWSSQQYVYIDICNLKGACQSKIQLNSSVLTMFCMHTHKNYNNIISNVPWGLNKDETRVWEIYPTPSPLQLQMLMDLKLPLVV